MKIIFAIGLLVLLSLGYIFSNESNVYTSNELPKPQNPLRNSKQLVEKVNTLALDFSELDTPYSLDSIDTEIAGLIRVDDTGNLVIDGELKSFIDYFLSSVGQVTPEQALQRMRLHIHQQLPKLAAKQAMTILTDYLAYKEFAFDALAQEVDAQRSEIDAQYRFEKLQQGLQTLYDIRRTHLGEHIANAMFFEDESYAQYTITNMRTDLNGELSDEERQIIKENARQQLPQKMADIIQYQEQEIATMQAYNNQIAEQPTIDVMREFAYQNFGSEQAEEIVNDYQNQLNLKQSYNQYNEAVKDIYAQNLTPESQKIEILSLAKSYFTDEEYSMVKAWGMAETRH
ncbi:MAG: lipase chaperone LimK [Bermanella sp.]|jgi:lipase chaperone LimK